jgi:hypothetical protein
VSDSVGDQIKASEGRLRGEITASEGRLRGEMAEMKDDLRGEITASEGRLRDEMAEMRNELRGEMAEMKHELRGEIRESEGRLTKLVCSEISRALGVVEERFTHHIGVLDERNRAEARELRRDLDAHRLDETLHRGAEPR